MTALIAQILIGTALVLGLLAFVVVLGNVFPTTEIATAIGTANGYIAILNPIIPISTVIFCLFVVTGIEIIVGVYKLVRWVWQKFPAFH